LERSLKDGWNLVSVPVHEPTTVKTYLNSKLPGNHLLKIWTYDGGWKMYEPGLDNSQDRNFNVFLPNRGYWMFMGADQTLSLDETAPLKSLSLDKTGWALISFNQTTSLDISTELLSEANFTSDHTPANITKVWGYSTKWASYSSQNQSSELTRIKPGFAYWVFVQNSESHALPPTMTIQPSGASGASELVIGGATSLFPPTSEPSGSRSRPTLSRLALSEGALASSTGNACLSPSNESLTIGYAKAFSFSGELLNTPSASPVQCHFSQGELQPVTYSINFNSSERSYLTSHPELTRNLVISVELFSGQEVKRILPEEVSEALNGTNTGSVQAKIDSTSTLSTALVGIEAARKLGIPEAQFQPGVLNSGLDYREDEASLISETELDILSFSQMITSASTTTGSAFEEMIQKIDQINAPETASNEDYQEGNFKKLSKILQGSSEESSQTTLTQLADHVQNLSFQGSQLLSKRKSSESQGVLTGEALSQFKTFTRSFFHSSSKQDSLLDIAELLGDSLDIAQATTGDTTLEQLSLSTFETLIQTVSDNLEALHSSESLTRTMELAARAVEFPQEAVKILAQNKEAARGLASIIGKSGVLLARSQEQQSSTLNGTSPQGEILSKLENADDFLTILVENAPDTQSVSKILAGAVVATAINTQATENIFAIISDLRELISTSEIELEVDLTAIMEESLGKVKKPELIAQTLAKNAKNASEATGVLSKIAGAISTNQMNTILLDEKLKEEFSLNTNVVASAGKNRRLQISGNEIEIFLNGSHSFDPAGSSLTYQWYSVSESETTSILKDLNTKTASLRLQNLEQGILRYRLIVTSADGRSAKDDVSFFLIPELPPVIRLRSFYSVQVDKPLWLDASSSFDPLTRNSQGLQFHWSFDSNINTVISAPQDSRTKIVFSDPGVFEGLLTVSKQGANTCTQAFRIHVRDLQPPVADTGFNLVLNQAQVIEKAGILLDNFSFSYQGNSNLDFEWEPRAYFSQIENQDSRSRNPLFIASAPGEYDISLTVREGSLADSDQLKVIIRNAYPPRAYAGQDRVVRLNQSMSLELDGSRSFSHTTASPDFQWSGPLSFSGGSENTEKAIIQLEPTQFSERTLLRFTLKVSDSSGESEDSVNLIIIPTIRPPVILLERFPNKGSYRPDDTLVLDASASFSQANSSLSFQWTNLSSLELFSGEDSLSSDSIILKIPEISEPSEFRLRLDLLDENNVSTLEYITIKARPKLLPPLIRVEPKTVLLEDRDDKSPLLLSALSSQSRGGGRLSFQWRVNSADISIISTGFEEPFLQLQAADHAVDGEAFVDLLVTDESGLTNSIQIPVKIKAKKSILPIEIRSLISQKFDFVTHRFVPEFDPSTKLYRFNPQEKLEAVIFSFDPNNNPRPYNLTAKLFVSDENHVKNGELLTNLNLNTEVEGEMGSASLSSILPSTPGFYGLEIQANVEIFAARNSSFYHFIEILPQSLSSPEIDLVIRSIESPSMGKTSIESNFFENSFGDDRVSLLLQAIPHGSFIDHLLDYEFTYSFEGTTGVTPPTIFLNPKGTNQVEFDLPLQAIAIPLYVTAQVTDLRSGQKSDPSTVTLFLNKSSRLAPVAHGGTYPKFFIPAHAIPATRLVTLDASQSFSPEGNPLEYSWEYLGSGLVFSGGSLNSIQGLHPSANLSEGIHFFELSVKDYTTSLSSSTIVTIELELERDTNKHSYGLSGDSSVSPFYISPNELIHIQSNWEVHALKPDLTTTSPKIKTRVFLEDNEIFRSNGEEFKTTASLSSPGSYEITVRAFYDSDNSDDYNETLDKSRILERIFTVRVREKLLPIQALVSNFPEVVSFKENSNLATIGNIEIGLENPNTPENEWSYTYRYGLVDALSQAPIPFSNSLGEQVPGYEEIRTPRTQIFTFLRNLGSGQYIFEVEVQALKLDGQKLIDQIHLPLKVQKNAQIPGSVEPIVQGGDRTALISWGLASSAEQYAVFFAPDPNINESSPSLTVTSLSVRLENLAPGQLYYFRVQALNAAGSGPLSNAISAWTAPQSPTGLTLQGGKQKISASWSPSSQVSGVPASYYFYYADQPGKIPDQAIQTGPITYNSITVEGLTENKTYYASISAKNPSGESNLSSIVSTETAPPAPEKPTVTGGSQQALVTWNPIINGVNSYNLYYSTHPELTLSSSILVENSSPGGQLVTGLAPGTHYYFCVTSLNTGGESDASPKGEASTLPDKMQTFSVQLENQRLLVSWPPVITATSYGLTYATTSVLDSVEALQVSTTGLSLNIDGLEHGTTYYLAMNSVNETGEGLRSDLQSIKTPPETPSSLNAIGGSKEIILSWNPVSEVDDYDVYYSENPDFTVTSAAVIRVKTPSARLTDLLEGATYHLAVAAQSNGTANSTAAFKWTTRGPVGAEIPSHHKAVIHNEKLWLIGGYIDSNNPNSSNIWSFDGNIWTSYDSKHWGNLHEHELASFQGKLWVLGGSGRLGQVWMSQDGKEWEQAPEGQWPGFERHQSIVFQDKIWTFGGYGEQGISKELWAFDGTNWVRHSDVPWQSFTQDGSALVFNDKLWVFKYLKTWSFDGTNWIQESGNPFFSGQVHQAGEALWTFDHEGKIYTSHDAMNWSQKNQIEAFQFTWNTTVKFFQGRFWFFPRYEDQGINLFTAISSDGQSSLLSSKISALTAPAPPENIQILGFDQQITILFNPSPTSSSQNLYYSTSPSQLLENGTRVSGVLSGHTLENLSFGEPFYLSLGALNLSGEGLLSSPRSLVLTPTVPTNITATGADHTAFISWDALPGSVNYLVHYSKSQNPSSTTPLKSEIISSSSYTVTSLDAGVQYDFQVSANNGPLSDKVSALMVPAPPGNIHVIGGGEQVTISFDDSLSATSYNLYFSLESNYSKLSAESRDSITSPFILTGLPAGSRLYLGLTASNSSGESSESTRAEALTSPPTPGSQVDQVIYSNTNGTLTRSWLESGVKVWQAPTPLPEGSSTQMDVSPNGMSQFIFSEGSKLYSANSLNGEGQSLITDFSTFETSQQLGVPDLLTRPSGTVLFQDKLWVFGGNSQNDMWSTTDAIHWVDHGRAAWTPRTGYLITVAPFGEGGEEKLYLFGGVNETDFLNEVWTSSDGVSWTQIATGAFSPSSHSGADNQLQGKIWIIGGLGSNFLPNNDVWSFDGTTWTQHFSPPWSARSKHGVKFFKDEIWLMGGDDGSVRKNDLWSFDGGSWTSHGVAPWSPRAAFSTLVYEDKLYVLGGQSADTSTSLTFTGLLSDVWVSEDGENWTSQAEIPWANKKVFQATVFQNEIQLIPNGFFGGLPMKSIEDLAWYESNTYEVVLKDSLFRPRYIRFEANASPERLDLLTHRLIREFDVYDSKKRLAITSTGAIILASLGPVFATLPSFDSITLISDSHVYKSPAFSPLGDAVYALRENGGSDEPVRFTWDGETSFGEAQSLGQEIGNNAKFTSMKISLSGQRLYLSGSIPSNSSTGLHSITTSGEDYRSYPIFEPTGDFLFLDGASFDSFTVTTDLVHGVKLEWAEVPGASSYRIEYASEPLPSSKMQSLDILKPPVQITELTENLEYFFQVFAINTSGESPVSAQHSAIPTTLPKLYTDHFGIEFIRIDPGTFVMGAPESDLEADNHEFPQHQVTITKPFYLGKYEVTQAQFEAVVSTSPLHPTTATTWPFVDPNIDYGIGDNFPAYYVSWDDITKVGGFLDMINLATGCDPSIVLTVTDRNRYRPDHVPSGCYRIPTEAEFEYSIRAGTTTRFYWGDEFDGAYAWDLTNSAYNPHPVGQKKENPWGLEDMSGNLWEWVYDWHKPDYYQEGPKIDPFGPPLGIWKVFRGGSWIMHTRVLRSSSRNRFGPDEYRRGNLGFRLVKTP